MTSSTLPMMTVDHPQWPDFYRRLRGPEGCNFRKEGGKATWTCSAGPGFELATPILKDMGCDVEASIAHFREHGGYCGCEIIFNVRSGPRRGRPGRKRQRTTGKRATKKTNRGSRS